MTREEAREVLGDVRAYLASRASLENEMLAGHTFTDICNAIKALEQEPKKGRTIDADELLNRIAEKCKTPSLSGATVNGLCGATAIIYDMLNESEG